MEERKTFTYNGVNSADYGLYISGDSVYNAPPRVYEMVDIAGRNGQLAIDQGRFENIEVTYPAFIFADTQTEFAQKLRDIRAWLMSPVGYQRLEDTYHPDEFRLGIYKSGLEVEPIFYNKAGRFELIFDCKPQRFLKSGEEEITIGEWGETETITGNIATFEGTDTTAIKSVVAQIVPKQEGSGDPSPTNVRPISGYDGVAVEQCGFNLLPTYAWNGIGYNPSVGSIISPTPSANQWTDDGNGTFTISNLGSWAQAGFISVPLEQKAYRFKMAVHGLQVGVYVLNKDYTVSRVSVLRNPASDGETITTNWTLSGNESYIAVYLSGKGTQAKVIQPQLELGSTATAYEPYHGQTYTKSLGRTVYGGTLDLTSGVLTVTQIKKTLDPSKVYSAMPYKTGFAKAYIVDGLDENAPTGTITDFLCDTLPPKSMYSTAEMGLYIYQQKNIAISVPFSAIDGYSDVGDNSNYKNAIIKFLTDNSVSVVYPLATPTTYQLTSEQIETILGVNNIWADTGEVSVEYGADPSVLINPTPFESLPLIEVTGTGTLTVGDVVITIDGEATQDIFIDSDIMEAYEDDNGAIISRNDRINLNGTDFPKLGEETKVESNGLTSVKITPRWWTI